MKIEKVSYGKTYSLGNYCSERIDLEASIDESTESVTDAVFQLREYCDQLHKKNNPHLYQEQHNYVPDTNVGEMPQQSGLQSVTEQKITLEEEEQNLLNEIANATADTLSQWQIPALRNQKTKGAYAMRKKQLNIS